APDHVAEVAFLAHVTIHTQADLAAAQDAAFRADDLACDRALLDVLGDVPRIALGLSDGLQIAAGHVEPAGVAEDHALGLRLADAKAALAERHDQFHFVM